MDVVLAVVGEIIVDDEGDLLDVLYLNNDGWVEWVVGTKSEKEGKDTYDTTSPDVCSNEYTARTLPKVLHDGISLLLRHLAVH